MRKSTSKEMRKSAFQRKEVTASKGKDDRVPRKSDVRV
jgi:hypothetical protein